VADDLLRALPNYEIRALRLLDDARSLLLWLLREWGLRPAWSDPAISMIRLLFSFIGAMLALEVV
jgi:hypothetical protein